MIKGLCIFGGIWAATATSVALARYPRIVETLEDGEVETLDPAEFIPTGDSIPFAYHYPSYFVSEKEVNKKFWEDRFNKKKKDDGKIKPSTRQMSSALEIVSGWDESIELSQGQYSLVDFCKRGYSFKSTFYDNRTWDFDYKDNTSWSPTHLDFWSLCSVFEEKPKTLYEHQLSQSSSDSVYSDEQIGKKLNGKLVKADENQAFWNIRQEEWKVTNVTDSTYFGNNKKDSHKIQDLCKKAYDKTESDQDNENTPSKTTVVKYCGLEWTWD